MGYGKGMVSSNDMNSHKRLAGADMKTNFGVTPFPGQSRSAKAMRKGSDGYMRDGKA